MRNFKTLGLLVVLLLAASCESYDFLPKQEEYKNYTKGNSIKLWYYTPGDSADVNELRSFFSFSDSIYDELNELAGELIALSSDSIYILEGLYPAVGKGSGCISIAKSAIFAYDLYYAKPGIDQSTTTIVGSIFSVTHGLLGVISFPINIIVTSAVNRSIESGSISNETNIELEELNKFARFPRGIPQGVELSRIE
jgi:hypothetical protein